MSNNTKFYPELTRKLKVELVCPKCCKMIRNQFEDIVDIDPTYYETDGFLIIYVQCPYCGIKLESSC